MSRKDVRPILDASRKDGWVWVETGHKLKGAHPAVKGTLVIVPGSRDVHAHRNIAASIQRSRRLGIVAP